jgi:hypothetical protein
VAAIVGAILTGLDKIPRIAGWPAVFVAAAAALAGIFSTPLTEWLRTKTNIQAGRNGAVDSLLKTGAILVRSVDRCDPVRDLGVHPAVEIPDGPRIPPYVRRSIDVSLDEHMLRGGLIILEGDSAAGKTRTAYEAIRRNWSVLRLRSVITPKDGPSLRACVEAGYRFHRTIVWLDDLERFLQTDGLDAGIIHTLSNSAERVILLATIRSRAKAAFEISTVRPDSQVYCFDSRRIFAAASTIYLDRRLDRAERDRAYGLASDARIAAALEAGADAGFAENIAAGPALVDRWQSGRHGANVTGAALVSAAIDFQRAGYLGPLPRLWLEEAYQAYIDRRSRTHLSIDEVRDAFAWATEAVRGASSCLEPWPEGRYIAFDYLVDFAQREAYRDTGDLNPIASTSKALESIPGEIWHVLGDHVAIDDPYYLSCVSASSCSLHPGMSLGLPAAIKNGHVDVANFNTETKLFALAKICVQLRVCIECQMLVLGLDLKKLIRFAFNILRPILGTDPLRLTEKRQAEALDILFHAISLDGEVPQESLQESLLEWQVYQALAEFDLDQLHQLGLLLNKLYGEGEADHLLKFIDARRDSSL